MPSYFSTEARWGPRTWDARTARELASFRGHESIVRSAVFGPDGTRVLTASSDRTARLWDPEDGREIAVLRGHEDELRTAVFSPDGARILTASDDGTARLWDARTGEPLVVLRGHGGPVTGVAFSPDGTRIATASFDGTVRVWDSLPYLQRHQEREALAESGPAAAALLEEYRPRGLEWARMAAEVRGSEWLDPSVRHSALNLMLRQAQAERDEAWLWILELLAATPDEEQVLLRVRADESRSSSFREAALGMLSLVEPEALNNDAWQAVRRADPAGPQLDRALLQARAAVALAPDTQHIVNTLGVALYRAGRFEEALAALQRSMDLGRRAGGADGPADLAFLAMTQQRLGMTEDAQETLERLRARMETANMQNLEDVEGLDFMAEAAALIDRP